MIEGSRPIPSPRHAPARAGVTQELARLDAEIVAELCATPSPFWQALIAQVARGLAHEPFDPADRVVPDISTEAKSLLAAELAYRGPRIEALFKRRRTLAAMERPDRLPGVHWADDVERRAARSVERIIGPSRGVRLVAIAALVLAVAGLVIQIAVQRWSPDGTTALRERIERLEDDRDELLQSLVETNRNVLHLRAEVEAHTNEEAR